MINKNIDPTKAPFLMMAIESSLFTPLVNCKVVKLKYKTMLKIMKINTLHNVLSFGVSFENDMVKCHLRHHLILIEDVQCLHKRPV